MLKNYYHILEVRQEATADEIRRSYYRLAMLYHPDRNPGNKAAEEKFKDLANAYEVLGNQLKRAYYDMQLYYYEHPHNYTGPQAGDTTQSNERARANKASDPYARSRDEVERDARRSRSFKLTAALFATVLFINTLDDGGCNNRLQYRNVPITIIDSTGKRIIIQNGGKPDTLLQADSLHKTDFFSSE